MKKFTKIGLVLILAAALIIGTQQGLKHFLKGPARHFNAIIVTGEAENVRAAAEIYKDDSSGSKDYFYKPVSYQTERWNEDGELMKDETTGEQLYYTYSFMAFSKSTARQMLNDQAFRVKTEEIPNGNIATIPLSEIKGLDGQENLYLGSPESLTEMKIGETIIPLTYANYAWIGYTPESATIVILDDATYDSIDSKEMQVSLIQLNGKTKDLRDDSSKNAVISKLSNVPNLDIDYVYIK